RPPRSPPSPFTTLFRSVVSVEDAAQDPAIVLGLAPSPDDELEAEQCLARVVSLFDAMTPRTQQIFLLHYVENYTYPQIAQQLGIDRKSTRLNSSHVKIS